MSSEKHLPKITELFKCMNLIFENAEQGKASVDLKIDDAAGGIQTGSFITLDEFYNGLKTPLSFDDHPLLLPEFVLFVNLFHYVLTFSGEYIDQATVTNGLDALKKRISSSRDPRDVRVMADRVYTYIVYDLYDNIGGKHGEKEQNEYINAIIADMKAKEPLPNNIKEDKNMIKQILLYKLHDYIQTNLWPRVSMYSLGKALSNTYEYDIANLKETMTDQNPYYDNDKKTMDARLFNVGCLNTLFDIINTTYDNKYNQFIDIFDLFLVKDAPDIFTSSINGQTIFETQANLIIETIKTTVATYILKNTTQNDGKLFSLTTCLNSAKNDMTYKRRLKEPEACNAAMTKQTVQPINLNSTKSINQYIANAIQIINACKYDDMATCDIYLDTKHKSEVGGIITKQIIALPYHINKTPALTIISEIDRKNYSDIFRKMFDAMFTLKFTQNLDKIDKAHVNPDYFNKISAYLTSLKDIQVGYNIPKECHDTLQNAIRYLDASKTFLINLELFLNKNDYENDMNNKNSDPWKSIIGFQQYIRTNSWQSIVLNKENRETARRRVAANKEMIDLFRDRFVFSKALNTYASQIAARDSKLDSLRTFFRNNPEILCNAGLGQLSSELCKFGNMFCYQQKPIFYKKTQDTYTFDYDCKSLSEKTAERRGSIISRKGGIRKAAIGKPIARIKQK